MRYLFVFACFFAISGCAASQAQFIYVNAASGAPVVDQSKFMDAKTVCLAESDKLSEPEAEPNEFMEFSQRASYLVRKDNVVRGCMLEKGYRLTQIALSR